MQSNDFEAAFSQFLDQSEYDAAEEALFSIVRAAFLAGWKAADGAVADSRQELKQLHTDF